MPFRLMITIPTHLAKFIRASVLGDSLRLRGLLGFSDQMLVGLVSFLIVVLNTYVDFAGVVLYGCVRFLAGMV